ncbi:MAG: hypothetical protein J2P57_02750 [Acidimicrobiaceae bacterium]|nr:hypothetical protein [Acidimicrobiaceae bacterium]
MGERSAATFGIGPNARQGFRPLAASSWSSVLTVSGVPTGPDTKAPGSGIQVVTNATQIL